MIIRVKEKVFNVGVTHEENIYIVKLSNLGQQGLSAYQIAVLNGFEGTEQEWLDSLQATGVETFLDLTDTPSSYTGQAGKYPKVNEAEDGLEFGDVPTIQELLEENAAQNNNIAVIQMSNNDLQVVAFSQGDNAVGISSSEVSVYSSSGGASINAQELLITDNVSETRYTLEGINKGDGFDFKEIEIGVGGGKFTIPDLDGQEETAATREWVQANVSGGAVNSVNGQTGVVVLDAEDIAETSTRLWLTDVLKTAYDNAVTWVTNAGANIRGTVLTGLSTATTTAILATDSILVAFGKLQGQINTKTLPLISDDTTAVITGVNVPTAFRSYQIPAGTLTNYNRLIMQMQVRKENGTANGAVQFWINTSNDFATATQIASVTANNIIQFAALERKMIMRGTNLLHINGTVNIASDSITSGQPYVSTAFNRANNIWVFLAANPASVTEVYTLEFFEMNARRIKTSI